MNQNDIDPSRFKPRKQHPLQHRVKASLNAKYCDDFNFYLAKIVNEIINESKSPEEILFRDFLIYDIREEIMRRYYKTEESWVRLGNYTAYYAEHDESPLPLYEIFNQRKILFKMQKRKYKLKNRFLKDSKGGKFSRRERLSKPLLKKLHNPTVYLEDVNVSSSVLPEKEQSRGDLEINYRIDYLNMIEFDEVHDIYNPQYSSEEENKNDDLNSSLFIMNESEIKPDFRLNRDDSILTRITNFEKMNESNIKENERQSVNETEMQVLRLISRKRDKIGLLNLNAHRDSKNPFKKKKINPLKNRRESDQNNHQSLSKKQSQNSIKIYTKKNKNLQNVCFGKKVRKQMSTNINNSKELLEVFTTSKAKVSMSPKIKIKGKSFKPKQSKSKTKNVIKIAKSNTVKYNVRYNREEGNHKGSPGKKSKHQYLVPIQSNKKSPERSHVSSKKTNLKSKKHKDIMHSKPTLSLSSYVKSLLNKSKNPKLFNTINNKRKMDLISKLTNFKNSSLSQNSKIIFKTLRETSVKEKEASLDKKRYVKNHSTHRKNNEINSEDFYHNQYGIPLAKLKKSPGKKGHYMDEYNYYHSSKKNKQLFMNKRKMNQSKSKKSHSKKRCNQNTIDNSGSLSSYKFNRVNSVKIIKNIQINTDAQH